MSDETPKSGTEKEESCCRCCGPDCCDQLAGWLRKLADALEATDKK